jgi:hypothetical protein
MTDAIPIAPEARPSLGTGEVLVGADIYLRDARGGLIPKKLVKPADLLEHETVEKVMGFARKLSAEIARFKAHTHADFAALTALLEQDYGVKRRGEKGNITFTNHDATARIQIQVADITEFGPSITVAKRLIDECLTEWGAESRIEVRALIDRVFAVGKDRAIDKASVFTLLRLDIQDERWLRAMDAIRDAIRVTGTKAYLRFAERDAPDGPWRSVTIDIASA